MSLLGFKDKDKHGALLSFLHVPIKFYINVIKLKLKVFLIFSN